MSHERWLREGDEWMRSVIVSEFGEALTEDWSDWLYQLFITHGPLPGPDLRRLASAAQHHVAEAASRRVAADVAGTTGLTVAIELVERDGNLQLACDGEFSSDDSGGFFSIGEEDAAGEVADIVQDVLVERLWRVWPTCPLHDSGLHPRSIDRGAVWLCRAGRHYTPVGALAGPADRP